MPSVHMNVLIHMIDDQETYFRREVIPPIEKKLPADLTVIHYSSTDSIQSQIRAYSNPGLVKVPFNKAGLLVKNKAVMSLDDFLTGAQIKEFEETYLLTSMGKVDGKRYYVPRKFETRIMVYRKSKVAEVYAQWRKNREEIDAAFKKLNGHGLPATYMLEEDPNEWDYYDVFVVGWMWAQSAYNGEKIGRVAHRGMKYAGTALRIIDRVFQCGGDSSDVISMRGDAVVDAFHWEAVYAAAGIYNPKMWEQQWSGTGIWQGFADEQVFLSFMTQLDCFFIHGTGRDGLHGYLQDPDDMGVAIMPRGFSSGR